MRMSAGYFYTQALAFAIRLMDLDLSFRIARWNVLFLAASLGAAAPVPVPYIFTETSQYDTRADQAASRFPRGAALQIVDSGRKRALFPGFAASADACISFDGKRVLFSAKQRRTDPWQIWEARLSGGTPRRITTVKQDAFTPFYLPGDRIVYSVRTPDGLQVEREPLDGGETTRLTFGRGDHLITDVLLDGRILLEAPHPGAGPGVRDIFSVYADGSGVETLRCDHVRDRRAGRQVSSGDIIFESAGRLGRFTSPRAREVAIEMPPGHFAGPIAELPGGEWLASFRQGASGPFILHRSKPNGGAPVAVLSAEGASAVQPVAVVARPVPKRHPSSLGNREGVNLLCLNVYTSKQKIAIGSVLSVRVWAVDITGGPVLLGRAPVAPDGSFFVEAPADQPIRFELLDAGGKVVAAEKGSFWARRGEQRVCVGCHAGPERAPDNVSPQVLQRSQEPVNLLFRQKSAGGRAK